MGSEEEEVCRTSKLFVTLLAVTQKLFAACLTAYTNELFFFLSEIPFQENPKTRKIRTESGVWIPATYKTDRYERWRGKAKVDQNERKEDSSDDEKNAKSVDRFGGGFRSRGALNGMNLEGTLCCTEQ